MRLIAGLLLCGLALPASAAELTLNDLPAVLNKLRDCGVIRCEAKALAILKDDGTLAINYENKARSIDLYGRGGSVSEALADLAGKLNAMGADSKATVGRIAPLLPTQ